MDKRIFAAAALLLSLPASQAAACCACDPEGTDLKVARITVANINAYTAFSTEAQTAAITLALQGSAAQISSNLRATIPAQAAIAEALSSQDTQRLIESDRIAAMKAYQYSTPLCQAATGADIAIAQSVAAEADRVLVSQANARRTGGYKRPEDSGLPVTAGITAFRERQPAFCDKNDPACRGAAGRRPEADRMPGAVLAMGRVQTADDQAQAAWLVNNLTMPLPVPALTPRDVVTADGQERYIRRGGYETQLNFAKDQVADILLTRRRPTANATYYNQLAAEAGLPQVTGMVSQEDMDRMRYKLRFNDRYTTKLAGLGDPTVLAREMVVLQAGEIEQRQRTNELLEGDVLSMAAILSTLVEGKLAASAGGMR